MDINDKEPLDCLACNDKKPKDCKTVENIKEFRLILPDKGCSLECYIVNGIYVCKVKCTF